MSQDTGPCSSVQLPVATGPLIAIVGQTGSGKTALAIALAKRFNGEIICADSRTVYKGMDIGTAKPTLVERQDIPHYGLDLVEPDEQFSAADFKTYALEKISEITGRGMLPIIVGGTGLYIDAVLFDYNFLPVADTQLRQELNQLTVEALQARIKDEGIAMPANSRNPRHLIRALETAGATAVHSELRPNSLVLGPQIDRDVLVSRLERRVDAMLAAGLVHEVRALSLQYGWDCEALRAPGYRDLREYLEGAISLGQAKEAIIKSHTRLAKRQRTWFQRNKSIHWLSTEDKMLSSVDLVTTFLNK